MLKEGVRDLVFLFFPCTCGACGKAVFPWEGWCGDCLANPPFLSREGRCEACLEPLTGDHSCLLASPGFNSTTSALLPYSGSLATWVAQLKGDHGVPYGARLALEHLCDQFLRLNRMRLAGPWDAVIPVPGRGGRGTLPGVITATLAKKCSEAVDSPLCQCFRLTNLLESQKKRHREERLTALRGELTLEDKKLSAGFRRILLVDDVTTTRSTLRIASELLRNRGVSWIHSLVFSVRDRGTGPA